MSDWGGAFALKEKQAALADSQVQLSPRVLVLRHLLLELVRPNCSCSSQPTSGFSFVSTLPLQEPSIRIYDDCMEPVLAP